MNMVTREEREAQNERDMLSGDALDAVPKPVFELAPAICKTCKGAGYTDAVWEEPDEFNDEGAWEYMECPECHGDGLNPKVSDELQCVVYAEQNAKELGSLLDTTCGKVREWKATLENADDSQLPNVIGIIIDEMEEVIRAADPEPIERE